MRSHAISEMSFSPQNLSEHRPGHGMHKRGSNRACTVKAIKDLPFLCLCKHKHHPIQAARQPLFEPLHRQEQVDRAVLSFPQRRESSLSELFWTPAFAGVTAGISLRLPLLPVTNDQQVQGTGYRAHRNANLKRPKPCTLNLAP